MDTLTHALTGVLAGRAIAGDRPRILTPKAAGWAGATAAVFPDADFVLAAFSQLVYLDLHQALTHSIPMMPVWAALLAIVCAWVYDRRSWRRPGGRWRLALEFFPITLAGVAVHTVADLCNIWGLLLWWPFDGTRVAADAIFVIDPLYSALVLVGIAATVAWRARAGAVLGLVLVGGYTAIAFAVNAHAGATLAASPEARGAAETRDFAAPPSLAHRRWVIRDADGWRYAFVDLRAERPVIDGDSWWARFTRAYRPATEAEWRTAMHPDDAGGFVTDAWRQPGLARYREFVEVPYVYAVGPDDGALCAWFADLRFTLPEVRQAFVWGACRDGAGGWAVHRRGRW